MFALQAVAVVVLLFLISVTLVRNDIRQTVRDARQDLLEKGTAISVNITTGLAQRAVVGEAIAATLERFPDLSVEDFDYLAAELRGNMKDILNIAPAPGLVVTLVYPLAPNRNVIGLDYQTRPDFLASIKRALNSGETVIAGPDKLVQGGTGLIMRIPVEIRNANGSEKRGIVSVVIDDKAFFAASGLAAESDGVQMAIRRDVETAGSPRMIFGAPSVFAMDAVIATIDAGDETWQLGLYPTAGWPAIGIRAYRIWAVTAVAMLVAVSLLLLVNRLQRRSETARRQLVDAIDALDDGFALFDSDDRLVICNKKYRKLYGDGADLLVPGRLYREIGEAGLARGLFPEAIGREREWLENHMRFHRNPKKTIIQKLQDGTWTRIVERRTSDGGTVGFRVDITELKRARETAEAANRAMTEFLNNINHEIRTPLSVIVGFIKFLAKPETLKSHQALKSLIADPASDRAQLSAAIDTYVAETRTFASRVETSATHLAELVHDTLDMAKIQNGVLDINPQAVDLTATIADCVQQFAPEAEKKGVTINHFTQPVTIRADPLRLRQILINVIGNAVKFTDAGSVGISCKQDAKYTSIIIADTGCGIAAKHLPHIFQKFWQVDGSVTRAHGGTGLGLAISRELMELHGGKIDVISDPGAGSTFTLRFPRVAPKGGKFGKAQAGHEGDSHPTTRD